MNRFQRLYLTLTSSIWLVSQGIIQQGADGFSNPAWVVISPLRWLLLCFGLAWLAFKVWTLLKAENEPSVQAIHPSMIEGQPIVQPIPPRQDSKSIERRERETESIAVESLRLKGEHEEGVKASETEKRNSRSAHEAAHAALRDLF